MLEDRFLFERIKRKITNNKAEIDKIKEAKKYYKNENEIIDKGVVPKNDSKDPLRNADNRIPHNIHQILVDEKISYLFTYPPIIELEDEDISKNVNDILGTSYARKIKDVGIEASNAGVAWIHYWIEEDVLVSKEGTKTQQRKFKYALVNTEEIVPVYDNGLERELDCVIRYYCQTEEVENLLEDKVYAYVEYWTKDKMIEWKIEVDINGGVVGGYPKTIEHSLGAVPFIQFNNNKYKQNDLSKIKRLLDLKDKVVSGFANDIEDIQQVIYIVENYGGENLAEFLGELKRYKTIRTETGDDGDSGGLSTMQIDIPVEARNVLLEYLKDQIYESGQGLQQDVESFGNASGVALKFFYRKLELKSGLLETEFKSSLGQLVKAILRFLGEDEELKVNQTWTRNMISNDLENAQIATTSKGIISDRTIRKNHPWVEDPVQEQEWLEEEQKASYDTSYNGIFNNSNVE